MRSFVKGLAMVAVLAVGMCSQLLAQEKLKVEDAPEAVRAHLAKRYSKYKVVALTEKQEPLEYSIELEKGKQTVSLVLDAAGNVLSRTKGRVYSFDGTEAPKDSEGPTMPSMGF